MAYNLAVDGFRDFARSVLILAQQPISRDPLSGVVDGVNNIFHTNYFPMLTSGSVGIYVGNSLVPATADYNTGEVILQMAPASQPKASYTVTPFTTQQMLSFLMRGFDELEARWSRGFHLVDTTGSPATEQSDALYVVDANGNDPQIGSLYFSTSRTQIALYMLCCEYTFNSLYMRQSSRDDYMWRETVRGMTVDKSMRPKNLNMAMEGMRMDMAAALEAAQGEFYTDGSQYGGAILGPVTRGYLAHFEWQTASKDQDYRGTEGYQYSLRSTSYP